MSPIMELERTLLGLGGFGRYRFPFFPDVLDAPAVADAPSSPGWVRVNVWDAGPNVVVVAEVPGCSEKDIQISFKRDTLTLTGERPNEVPEGYTAHRRERPSMRFARSIRFGVPIDVDKIQAVVKNGLLTVTLPRAAAATPRTIAVQSTNN